MKKYYNKISLFSRFVNFSLKFTSNSKNYLSEENTKKFMDEYQNFKKGYNLYQELDFGKENFDNIEVYNYNGTIENSKDRILVYIHGGSFLEEAISYQLNFAKKIAIKTNSTLIVLRYKLLPESNYKILYNEMNELYERIENKNVEVNFLGDSSGGGFILSYSMYLRDNNRKLPKNLLMLSPWVDLSMTNPELKNSVKKDNMSEIEGNRYCGKLWAVDVDVKNPIVSPIYGTFENLPKITIMTGSYDILQPDCLKFSNILDNQGIDHNYIEYIKQSHDFGCYPTKEGKLLIEDITNIINES